jgi:fatty-acid desaturase
MSADIKSVNTLLDDRSSPRAKPPRPEPTTTSAPKGTQRLEMPIAAQPVRILWPYVVSISLIHVVALLALVPWFFSWTGLIVAIAGHYVFGMLGMTLGYHRLLTHRGFTCPKWLEHGLALLGVCCLQDTPARWVAVHRMHHQHSDDQPDPHTPKVSLFWSHVGWLFYQNREHDHFWHFERYVRDMLTDPFYQRLERKHAAFKIYGLHAALFLLVGFLIGWAASGTLPGGIHLGLSLVVWGVAVRTVFVWHVTWAVNSLSHVSGYKNYETRDDSRNNWLVALVAHGEGWHNNHHAQPRAALHGHRWWEFDLTWQVVRVLELVGLARDVKRPRSPHEKVESADAA